MLALTAPVHFERVQACLRELTGADEQLVASDDTRTSVALLDQVLVASEGSWPHPGEAAKLTAPERDRLLAEIWLRTWGARIVGSPLCQSCGAQFDIDFDLEALCASVWRAPPATEVALEDGRCFRVPTAVDEFAVAGLPRGTAIERLVVRCAIGDRPAITDGCVVAAALDVAAPVLDLDLDAPCPECRATNVVVFRMQSYLLRALNAERLRLPRQIHALARLYGWTVAEILSLPRSTRLSLVRLAEAAVAPRRVS